MKRLFFSLVTLTVLFSCGKENNPGSNNDNGNNGKEDVVATAVKLNKSELILEKGGNEVLVVTYAPSNVTNKTLTWVSSDTSVATVSDGIVVGVAPGNTEIIVKCGDVIDKCKVKVVISATSISLNHSALEMVIRENYSLSVTIEPEGTTDDVFWESTNNQIATVNEGVISAISPGSTTIKATAGEVKAECNITVLPPKGSIDLGIVITRDDGTSYSLYWAECNLGANLPEEYGDYYAWGERSTKDIFLWDNYTLCYGEIYDILKYNDDIKFGHVDYKTELELVDDIAHLQLNGLWRMPTLEECLELDRQCSYAWINQNGVPGMQLTGPNGNCLFFPAAGYKYGYDEQPGRQSLGHVASVWTSTRGQASTTAMSFKAYDSVGRFDGKMETRACGIPIRPVTEQLNSLKPMTVVSLRGSTCK